MYSGLPLIADMARSAFPFSEPIYIGEHAFWVQAIPCSAVAQQRRKIIRNGVALVGEESVSVGHRRQRGRRVNQETPPMRVYIIGNDGITLCREVPATVNEGEIAVASKEELHAARLSGKRLLGLWNALPGVENRRKVGDREALIDQLWSAIEALPDPDRQSDTKGPSKQVAVIAMLQRPRAQPSRKSPAQWGGSGTRSEVSSPEP
jgi:hypothetical protein